KTQLLRQFIRGHFWTLVAWCELRDDYRQFRLDRIQALRMHDEEFQSAETKSLKHYIAQYESKD
ncbi:WYL domain-containing protein, partial [Escherichia coli]|nr:WYL domain-containing protein [Escherichia coli]